MVRPNVGGKLHRFVSEFELAGDRMVPPLDAGVAEADVYARPICCETPAPSETLNLATHHSAILKSGRLHD